MGTAGLWQLWLDSFTRVPRAVTPPVLWSVVEGVGRSVGLLSPENPQVSIEHVPEAMIAARGDGRVVVANARAAALLGRRRGELIGLPLDTLFRLSPSDLMPDGFELIGLGCDAAEFCVEVRADVISTDAGDLVIALIRDVTQRRAADLERRVAEQRLRLALETGQIGTWAVDVETSTAVWDERLHRIFGLRPDSFPGTLEAFLELVHPDDRAKIADIVARGLQERASYEFEFRALLPGGALRYMSSRSDVIRCERGRPVRIAGVCMDVTDRVHAQQRLQRSHDDLERRVAERTQELRRSIQELDEFAQIVSHDLKEPLRGIYNYARFVVEDEGERLGPEARQKLERISHLASRMNELVDSILQTARVGRFDVQRDVDVGHVVADVVASLESLLTQEKVELRLADGFPSANCDPQRLAEVFRNLLTNAIKYNDKSSKLVEVGSTAVEDSPTPAFYVRDNGIGIDREHFASIFDMFKRLHARDAYGGGTGAGLAIAKKIVQLHGGRIWVESKPAEGSTFYFTIGQGEAANAEAARDNEAGVASA